MNQGQEKEGCFGKSDLQRGGETKVGCFGKNPRGEREDDQEVDLGNGFQTCFNYSHVRIGHHQISVLHSGYVQGKPQSCHPQIIAPPPPCFQPLLLNGKVDRFVDDCHRNQGGEKEDAEAKKIFTSWRLNTAEVDDGVVDLDRPADHAAGEDD